MQIIRKARRSIVLLFPNVYRDFKVDEFQGDDTVDLSIIDIREI